MAKLSRHIIFSVRKSTFFLSCYPLIFYPPGALPYQGAFCGIVLSYIQRPVFRCRLNLWTGNVSVGCSIGGVVLCSRLYEVVHF